MRNTIRKILFVSGLGLFISGVASADIVKKSSVHSVKETMDEFEALVKSKGMSIFARVDHKKMRQVLI